MHIYIKVFYTRSYITLAPSLFKTTLNTLIKRYDQLMLGLIFDILGIINNQ